MLSHLSPLKQRLIMGGVSAFLVLFFIIMAPYPYFRPIFALITSTVIATAVWEYYNIAKTKGYQPLDKIGIASTAIYVLSVFAASQMPMQFMPEIVLWLTLLVFFINYFVTGPNPFVNLAISVFAIGYLTIPLATLLNIVYLPAESAQDGRWWLIYLIVVTKMTDTGAYFFGKRFGKHKLAPYISPGKTWEGAIGGFFTAIASSFFLYFLLQLFYEKLPIDLTPLLCLVLSGILSIVAQFGDLAESLLKRDVGVKDSNPVLPGLGGTLDVVDSLVFTAPLMHIYLQLQTH